MRGVAMAALESWRNPEHIEFSPEVRERAVRLEREQVPHHTSQWATIAAIAPKLGCTPET